MLSSRIPGFKSKQIIFLTRLSSTAQETKTLQPPNPKKIGSDMIGPPDPVSNLRRIIFKQPSNETDIEKRYRELRGEVQEWNQKFWTQHNTRFFQVNT